MAAVVGYNVDGPAKLALLDMIPVVDDNEIPLQCVVVVAVAAAVYSFDVAVVVAVDDDVVIVAAADDV